MDGYSATNEAQFRWSDFTEKPLYLTCTAITTLEDSSESHYMAFAAEESRVQGGKQIQLA